jgi:ubiquinone biosynthesis protein UbiJ
MPGSSLLPELLAGVLRDAATRFVRLDPNSPRYLAPLAGKVIGLRLTPLDGWIFLCPSEIAIDILPSFGGKPDVSFSGSPLAFARMGLSDSPRTALFSGEVTVEGDMTVARHFQSLFERLDIAWEDWLAQYTGQTLASQLASVVRSAKAWTADSVETGRLNLAEYWQEETRELPAKPEAEWFYSDVDTLRADADRLEARLRRLENQPGDEH